VVDLKLIHNFVTAHRAPSKQVGTMLLKPLKAQPPYNSVAISWPAVVQKFSHEVVFTAGKDAEPEAEVLGAGSVEYVQECKLQAGLS
jgi:hypothetical protein